MAASSMGVELNKKFTFVHSISTIIMEILFPPIMFCRLGDIVFHKHI